MGSRFTAAAAIVAWIVAASPALAGGPASAADHAKQAMVAYDLQDWKTAIAEYQEAFRTDQKSEYLWGLAQAQRQSGDFAAAIRSFKAFARTANNEKQSTAAAIQISKCELELSKVDKPSAPPVTSETTSPPVTTTQTTKPSETTPTVTVAMPVVVQSETPPPKKWYADAFGDALIIGGIAAAGVGTGFLVKSGSDAAGSFDQTISRVVGVGSLVVSGTLIVDGIIRWVLVGGSQTRTSGLRLSPTVGPHTAQVAIIGRF